MSARFFASPAAFRSWLVQNHAKMTEVVVGFWKRGTGKPSLTWSESVDEALCFGWIDSVRHGLGAEAFSIRFTPRKRGSNWSLINIAKVKVLVRTKRMRAAGLRAYKARSAAQTGVYAFEQKRDATLSPAQRKRLGSNRKAEAYFDAKPPWYRRAVIHWIATAKREETRESRLATLIACSASGKDIPLLARRT